MKRAAHAALFAFRQVFQAIKPLWRARSTSSKRFVATSFRAAGAR